MDDDDNKVISLAETIHKKTEGNAFFILMFLRSLHDEKLLQYNFGALKWTWDGDAVNAKMVAENVASVLVKKMNRLHEETRMGLMVASCLGTTFRLSAVVKVLNGISPIEMRTSMRSSMGSMSESDSLLCSDVDVSNTDRDDCDSSYASSIEELEEEGLCEIDNNECHFVHDQIQSAAFDLICPEKRDAFQGEIGRILLQSLSQEELDASLFEVVGLLNCAASASTIEKERNLLARMNLKAGIKASENSAFDAAKVYFKAGREALVSRGWEGDYNTMLDLCSHGANAFYVTGDFDSMNELIDEVLSKDIDTMEKYRVSHIKVKSLFTAGKVNECIDVALDFRRQLGLPILKRKPASKFTIKKEFIRVMKLVKNKTAEDIASLPALSDEVYEMGQRLNIFLSAPVYNVEPTMFPLILFQGVTISLKYGLDSSSSSYFAGLGMMLCGHFGKPQKGLEMAKAAKLILEKPGVPRNADTRFIIHYFCYHWVSPLQDSISSLLNGYQIGLEIGENESAGYCLFGRGYHLYFIGRPLDSIQKELEVTVSVLAQLNQDIVNSYSMILLVTVKRLRGIDIEAGEKILDSIESNNNIALTSYINVMKLEVLVFFQQWSEAIDLARKAGDIRFILVGTFASVRYTFLETLAFLKAAQSASGWERRKMKKHALKTKQIIRGWAKKGNVNVVQYLHILDAELAVLNGKSMQATASFNAAIATSRRNGLIQDRALAHELASAYFQAQGDDNWGDYHIDCAKTCYEEWGCSERV